MAKSAAQRMDGQAVTKATAQLDREIALEGAISKAREKAAQSNRRHSIWLTRDGEYRVRPMFEKVSPLWSFVRHVPSDEEMRR